MSSSQRCLIIAEAGVNHNGSVDAAFRLVDIAKESGADVVKFQTFRAESLVTKSAKRAAYQVRETGSSDSQFEMLKKLELSFDDFQRVADYCEKKQIEFLSTAFDIECLDFLVCKTGIKRIKIPSGELTNGPLIEAAAKTGLPIILSTGMSSVQEIEDALDVIAWVKSGHVGDFKGAFKSNRPLDIPLDILHCTTEYPAPLSELNLRAIPEIKRIFGINTGYSDHSEGIFASVAAVAIGASVIEKHFTSSKLLSGPDHKASLDPTELMQLVLQIRMLEEALGSGFKQPTTSELANSKVARKSLVASQNIGKGEVFCPRNITVKRPGTGISPMKYWRILGKEASRPYSADELIDEDL